LNINSKSKKTYPSKNVVNFAVRESDKKNFKVILPITVAAVILAVLFIKFGIVDLVSAKNTVEVNMANYQNQTNKLLEYNKDYELVALEYQSYNLSKDENGNVVNVTPMKSLKMLESELLSVSHVQNFSITTDTITVKYGGVNLDKISEIYNTIKQNNIVDSVQVFTAGSQNDNSKNTVATMTIVLKGSGTVSQSSTGGNNQ
jgi:sulfur relay (sulfurtransferase) DsrF/TusC family protein